MYKMLMLLEFFDIFKPEQNKFSDRALGVHETYETFGKELEYVVSVVNDRDKGEKYIWTEIEVDNGREIVAGFIQENAYLYYVCAVPNFLPVSQKVVWEYQDDCTCSADGIDPEDCDICLGDEYMPVQFNFREDIVRYFGEELGNQQI